MLPPVLEWSGSGAGPLWQKVVPGSLSRMSGCCLTLLFFFFFFPVLGLLCVSKRKTFKNMMAVELASWPTLSPESQCSFDSDFTANFESDFVMTSVPSLRDHVKIAIQTSLCCSLVRADHLQAPA